VYLFIFIIIIILFLISVFSRENRIANIPFFFFFFTVYSQIPLAEQKTGLHVHKTVFSQCIKVHKVWAAWSSGW